MGRHQQPIQLIRTRYDGLPRTRKAAKARTLLRRTTEGVCINCGQLPKPGRRRCELCALINVYRVQLWKARRNHAPAEVIDRYSALIREARAELREDPT